MDSYTLNVYFCNIILHLVYEVSAVQLLFRQYILQFVLELLLYPLVQLIE